MQDNSEWKINYSVYTKIRQWSIVSTEILNSLMRLKEDIKKEWLLPKEVHC